jgi:hypothetical protein
MSSVPTSPGQCQQTGAGATPSQLDIIADINERAARQHRRQRARRIAVRVGSAALLVAALTWVAMQGDALRVPASRQPAESPAVDLAVPAPAALPAPGAPPASASMKAAAVPLGDTVAADKRSGRQARAGALQSQPERSGAEAAREAQQEQEQAGAASPGAPEPAPAAARPAAEPRPGVQELCSDSGNVFSRSFCHVRECRKPERANDAVCVRLREIERARPSGGQ